MKRHKLTRRAFAGGGVAMLATAANGEEHEPVKQMIIGNSVKDFGATGDGHTDDSSALAAAVASGKALFWPSGTYLTKPMTVSKADVFWRSEGATIKAIHKGDHILDVTGGGSVDIEGLAFVGRGSETLPSRRIAGSASTSTGLITVVGGLNVRISNCSARKFYNLISVLDCEIVEISGCRELKNWLVYAILWSASRFASIVHNHIYDCDQYGPANAYGIHGTGNQAASRPLEYSSISFNIIRNVNSWDGIMTHECAKLKIIGNTITGVRTGIDVTKAQDRPIHHVIISNNSITSTSLDTWSSKPALHAGIIIEGNGLLSVADGILISGNLVDGFYNVQGLVCSGNSSNITVTDTSHASITGNIVMNSGPHQSSAGVYVVGRCNGLTIANNNLSGFMAAGGIRFANADSDCTSIQGGTIRQAKSNDDAIYATGTRIDQLALGGIATNSVNYFAQSDSDIGILSSFAGDLDVPGVYKVDGKQVIGAQQKAIKWPLGGSTDDVEARATIKTILEVMQQHGLIAPG